MKRCLLIALLLVGCPVRVDPPDPSSFCPGRPNCGQCAEGTCVWCEAVGERVGCYAPGSEPQGCRPVTVLELCPGAIP